MLKQKILVTGGCGYIGGHSLVVLLEAGYEVISVDNLSRGSMRMLRGVEQICGTAVKNYKVDLSNFEDVETIFLENPDLTGVIHFAAYKLVAESVSEPLIYFQNNITSLVTLLQCMKKAGVNNFIFSSSCSVYGNLKELPVSEKTPLAAPQSPYARTKVMGEQICQDTATLLDGLRIVILRYFNPVGAHPSALIGEIQDKPQNLVPVITQTAIGKRACMTVHGTDYDTRDGSCVRDYIHVMDIAAAHRLAIEYLYDGRNTVACEIFNLGSGNGVTVLELIHAFEEVASKKLNYEKGPRRNGDIEAVYANNNKAMELLGWLPKYDLKKMMTTAWAWEKTLQMEEKAPLN